MAKNGNKFILEVHDLHKDFGGIKARTGIRSASPAGDSAWKVYKDSTGIRG